MLSKRLKPVIDQGYNSVLFRYAKGFVWCVQFCRRRGITLHFPLAAEGPGRLK